MIVKKVFQKSPFRGMGKDMARYLSSLGYDLILVARRKTYLENLKKELSTNVKIIPYDLAVQDNLDNLWNEVKDEDIDLLVNNAGFGLFGEFDKTDLDREFEMIDVNIKALHYLTKNFLIKFKKEDKGRILNVASSAGFMAGPKLSTYYASKNYVLRLSEAIYEELKVAKSNVHISCLCPGPVDTEFNKVAHGEFHTKSLTSEYVAKYAINLTLKNKLYIIPSFRMKAAIFLTRLVPRKLLLKITYLIQDRKTR